MADFDQVALVPARVVAEGPEAAENGNENRIAEEEAAVAMTDPLATVLSVVDPTARNLPTAPDTTVSLVPDPAPAFHNPLPVAMAPYMAYYSSSSVVDYPSHTPSRHTALRSSLHSPSKFQF